MKRHTAVLAALAIAFSFTTAHAQTPPKPIDLFEAYGLHPLQGKLQVRNLVATPELAAARYPHAFARFAAIGWQPGKFMALSAFDAAWADAVWSDHGGGQPLNGYLVSTAAVNVPAGTYWQTVTALFSTGTYTGAGTAWTDTGANTHATQLVIWHEQWQGDPAERHSLQAGTWGWLDNFGYVEATHLQGFRLNGRSKEMPGERFTSTGLRMWRPGELAHVTNVYAYNFRTDGFELFAPTPVHLGHLSAFENVKAGLSCKGCWGGTIQLDYLSGDDNAVLVESVAGYGFEGGGMWNIGALKHENAITGGRVHRDHVVGYFAGQFGVNIGAVNCSNGFEAIDAAFVLVPRLTDGSPQTCLLQVGAMKGYNFAAVVQDIAAGKAYRSPGSYVPFAFTYTNAGGGTMSSSIPLGQVAHPCPDRLGGYPVGGVPNYSACSPAFRYIVQGPPAYANTVYLDDTPPPNPDPGPGPIDPPPATRWDTVAKWDAITVNSSTFSKALAAVVTLERVELQAFRITAAPNYSALAVPASGSGYLAVKADGSWTVAGVTAAVVATRQDGTTTDRTEAGTTYARVIVTLAEPITVARLGTFAGAGGALRYTCKGMAWSVRR